MDMKDFKMNPNVLQGNQKTRFVFFESSDDVGEGLNHQDKEVRLAAVRSKHFGPEHMAVALNHEDEDVREEAKKSKHFGHPDS